MLRRLFFWWRYLTGQAPWDTGQTPPEIVSLVEGGELPPGRAVDLGCGTGTNVLYLARHGWTAVGVDFVPRAIRIARRKARRQGLADRARFMVGDVTRLSADDLGGPFDLAMDIGCGHGLPDEARDAYARTLSALVRPGGTVMLYMFRPSAERPRGLTPDEVSQLFAPDFEVVWSDLGADSASGSSSAWYRLTRREST